MNEAFLYFSNVNGFLSDYWGNHLMPGSANCPVDSSPNRPNGAADGLNLMINTAGGPYAGLIYHEYNHNVLYRAYGDWMELYSGKFSDGAALDEGLADYYASSIKNYGRPMACVNRRLDGKIKYFPPAPPYDDQHKGHFRGQIIGGACWDLLNSLAGVDNLVYDVVDNYLGIDPTFGEFMDCILEADDNDGNIFNGTPNQNAIFSAFNDDHWIMGNYVAGTLYRDMTWEGDIVVLDNVIVPDGITLTNSA